MIFINKKYSMNNKKFQLGILKTLIKEEVKKQFYFNENVDVASAVASTDASSATKLGTPELVVQKSQDGSGITVYINNVNGYKSFSLKGFDDYIKIIPVVNKKSGSNSYIQINYGLETTANEKGAKMLIETMQFKIQSNPTDKSIILQLYYDFPLDKAYKAKYGQIYDFNKNYRQGELHSGNYSTTEKLDIFIPVNIEFKGKIA